MKLSEKLKQLQYDLLHGDLEEYEIEDALNRCIEDAEYYEWDTTNTP